MTRPAAKIDHTTHAPHPGSICVDGAALARAPAGGEKLWREKRYQDESREATRLMRTDPGARSAPPAHERFEPIDVRQGSMNDGARTLAAGDDACRAPGAMHQGGPRTGALVLLVHTRVAP